MDIFKLSRTWFDWCFENPEKIKPNHSALYFFCIEHCNRLGWKEKFGLPTTMAKEAIGISSYNTYINTLNDLIDWGFIKLIEKSKNQYSSNIIAISKFNKALDKALDKALIKHSIKHVSKQSESIDSIDIQETNIQETINNNTSNWKNSFEIYLNSLNNSLIELLSNENWIKEREKFNPNVDVKLSLEKACKEFWGTEAGWKYKKAKRTTEINWKRTLETAITMNKVYKPKQDYIPNQF
jgi:hypothetical protein